MRGIVRDLVLIGATAIAVTGVQVYAQNEPEPDHFTFQCQSGRLVVTDVIEHAVDTALVLGMDVRGQTTVLENCAATFYDAANEQVDVLDQ